MTNHYLYPKPDEKILSRLENLKIEELYFSDFIFYENKIKINLASNQHKIIFDKILNKLNIKNFYSYRYESNVSAYTADYLIFETNTEQADFFIRLYEEQKKEEADAYKKWLDDCKKNREAKKEYEEKIKKEIFQELGIWEVTKKYYEYTTYEYRQIKEIDKKIEKYLKEKITTKNGNPNWYHILSYWPELGVSRNDEYKKVKILLTLKEKIDIFTLKYADWQMSKNI